MNRVIQMVKMLHEEPKPFPIDGYRLRSFEDQCDLAAWLALRQKAFAREKLGVRDWQASDFRHEFSTKPWWNPEHCWVVESNQQEFQATVPVLDSPAGNHNIVGSVTLAMRSGETADRAVVHWLMVHPRFRGKGLARWLLAKLEAQAWQLGHRAVYLETHSAWEAAARCYGAAGYAAV